MLLLYASSITTAVICRNVLLLLTSISYVFNILDQWLVGTLSILLLIILVSTVGYYRREGLLMKSIYLSIDILTLFFVIR